ncbi:MAG: non-ribosomal peptide synthetase [Beijerinckiaceae bacterium]|nr:non-ribosomal peptide synthetase [Beijerinckiaceae bacterium]
MQLGDCGIVPQYFQAQVTERPHFFAVRSGASHLTYAELDAKTDALCCRLTEAGAGRGTLVGVLLERSLAAIVSFLAVLKAGAAFVPLDPCSPESSILEIAWRHKLACVVSDDATMRRFPRLASETAVLDASVPVSSDFHGPCLQPVKIAGSDPACIMFTSGSTGEPKGVVIPHRAVVRLVKNPGYMRFSADQVFLQASSLTFDASIFEIWGALLNGAELVIPEPGLLSLDTIASAVENEGVTTLFLTSGLFNLMIDQRPEPLRKLRYLISGGDVMSPAHVAKAARLLDAGDFISVYGPTENTTYTTTFTAPRDFSEESPVPIGWPIAGTILRILDDGMRPVPAGSAGELYAGGTGLALGYLGAPELTRSKFFADPEDSSRQLYRTGDIVRQDETGLLHFLGRVDNQIKVNGIRVEPEHVEAVLRRKLDLTDIAIVACSLPNGAKHLVAFVIPIPGAAVSNTALREAAARHLPQNMVPSRFEIADEFPLTRTGKIDRLALSRLAASQRHGNTAGAPGSASPESVLIDVWRRHLQLGSVDIDKNFFDLGGTSLQILGVHAELEQLYPGRLSIQDLFGLPTIRLVQERLSGKGAERAATTAAARAALQRRALQNRPGSALQANAAGVK